MKFKCVDMLEASLVTFINRPNKPTYFMESYIEGHFSKYNGNAGYVDRASPRLRATPQAFSHFTFCRTQGEKIVVDVQGVGDLLTDPQLHTREGNSGPGDGGLALSCVRRSRHESRKLQIKRSRWLARAKQAKHATSCPTS